MFRAGLTGGIASGKSTISRLFSELGIPVIDTDVISHQLMQPGQEAYLKTLQHFGPGILNQADNSLNRAVLRQLVFSQPDQKKWLENLLHPLIRMQTEYQINQAGSAPYVLVVVPLMFETGFNKLLDHIIALDCSPSCQIDRLMQRDHIDTELAHKMIASQLDNEQRLQQADSILKNDDNKNRNTEVLKLHQQLLQAARNQKPHP